MKCLRIRLTQSSANYRKEESVVNRMTYPLPPFSTVIGAIHNACGYKEYHKMDISIQGRYETLDRKVFKENVFLNNVQKDRGTLVKFAENDKLHSGYVKVASAQKSQGNDFMTGKTISVVDKALIEEYREIKVTEERRNKLFKKVEERTKKYSKQKKEFDKKSDEYLELKRKEDRLKNYVKLLKEEHYKKYDSKYEKFASLTTGVGYYEVLYGIELIIHISSDEETLRDIYENVYNIKSIGRSEDFINVEEAEFVELLDEIEEDVVSEYSAYLDLEAVRNYSILTKDKTSQSINGTKYYLNKDYKFNEKTGNREFNKKKVLYASKYFIEECSEEDNVYFDGKYIVNLI